MKPDLGRKSNLKSLAKIMSELTLVSKNKSFEGFQCVYSFKSEILKSFTNFSIYLPPTPIKNVPVIYWLSGLTCTEENFIIKSGFQRYASEHGFAVVGPDTSPRGIDVKSEAFVGESASFYVDATQGEWKNNYQMFSYVTKELPSVIKENFPVDITNQSIMGHSMGGHGALICYLKNPGLYKSVSVFAPICNPSLSSTCIKAFKEYLGDEEEWKAYDSTDLVLHYKGPKTPILFDQGTADSFYLDKKLLSENLLASCEKVGLPVNFRLHEGYDHGYYFIASFISDHFKHHANYLK